MSQQSRTTIKTYFTTGAKPTQLDFDNFIDSGINQTDDDITVSSDQNVGFGNKTPSEKVSITSQLISCSWTVNADAGKANFTASETITGKIAKGDYLMIGATIFQVKSIGATDTFTTENPTTAKITNGTVKRLGGVFSVTVGANNDVALYVAPKGKVGIGTNTPSEILDVDGTVKATSFSGSGAQLTDIPSGELTGDISLSGNITATGTSPSGGTITATEFSGSGSKITNLDAGKLASGDITLKESTITAKTFKGDGSQLTGISTTPNGIQYFVVDQPCINSGDQVKLSWNITGANFIELTYFENYLVQTLNSLNKRESGMYSQQFGKAFNPDITVTYTLTAYNLPNDKEVPSPTNQPTWTDQAQVQVTVVPPVGSYMNDQNNQHVTAKQAVLNAVELFPFLRYLNQANVSLLAISMNKIFGATDIGPAIANYYQTVKNYPWSSSVNGQWITDAISQANRQS